MSSWKETERHVLIPLIIYFFCRLIFFHKKPLNGDGLIQAGVTAIGDTDNWTKAGVMMRESYEIWAKVGIAVVLPDFFLLNR